MVSCNAYFAQLGTYNVGAQQLFDTGNLLGIAMATPDTAQQLNKSLPQSSYGQGQVVASPFQMARVAAAVANGGQMPQGRWITDDSNDRTPRRRQSSVRTWRRPWAVHARGGDQGTGPRAAPIAVPIAGKTGTAELARPQPSHAWFIGFAPYSSGRRIAFAVLIENGVTAEPTRLRGCSPGAAENLVNACAKPGLTGNSHEFLFGSGKNHRARIPQMDCAGLRPRPFR